MPTTLFPNDSLSFLPNSVFQFQQQHPPDYNLITGNESSNQSSGSESSSSISAQENSRSPLRSPDTTTHEEVAADKPYLKIIEEPQDLFRFRYRTEMQGTHGAILGVKSGRHSKSFPKVKLFNYSGKTVKVYCRLFTAGNPPEERVAHTHRLVGKIRQSVMDDPHWRQLSETNGFTAEFEQMTILFTKKEEQLDYLTNKKSDHIQRGFTDGAGYTISQANIRTAAMEELKKMNLNIVTLRFDVMIDGEGGKMTPLCDPVYSGIICNMKNPMTNQLRICRINKCCGSCDGKEEIMIFVEKINKSNIRIKFTEIDDETESSWTAYGTFNPETDVHHQYGIVFKTPPYKDPNITSEVDVFFRLERTSDHAVSDPVKFSYLPNRDRIREMKRKRPRIDNSIVFNKHIWGMETNMVPELKVLPQDKNDIVPVLRDTMLSFENPLTEEDLDCQLEYPSFDSTLDNIPSADSDVLSQFLHSDTGGEYIEQYMQLMNEDPCTDFQVDGVSSRFSWTFDQSLFPKRKGEIRVRPEKAKYESESENMIIAYPQMMDTVKCDANYDFEKSMGNMFSKESSRPSKFNAKPEMNLLRGETSSSVKPEMAMPTHQTAVPNVSQATYQMARMQSDQARSKMASPQSDRLISPVPLNVFHSDRHAGKLDDNEGAEKPTKRQGFSVDLPSTAAGSSVESVTDSLQSINVTDRELTFRDLVFPKVQMDDGEPNENAGEAPPETRKDSAKQHLTEENIMIKTEKTINILLKMRKLKKIKDDQFNEGLAKLYKHTIGDSENCVLHVLAAISEPPSSLGVKIINMVKVMSKLNYLETGDIINAVNAEHETPLHIAVSHGHPDTVRLLIQVGADVNATDARQDTPTHVAARRHSDEMKVLEPLLRARPDLTKINSEGMTALHVAVSLRKSDVISCLLIKLERTESERWFDFANLGDRLRGDTALHTAVHNGFKEVVALLLNFDGIKINVMNLAGKTPLALSYLKSDSVSMDIRDMLLAHGGDKSLVNETVADVKTEPDSESEAEANDREGDDPKQGEESSSSDTKTVTKDCEWLRLLDSEELRRLSVHLDSTSLWITLADSLKFKANEIDLCSMERSPTIAMLKMAALSKPHVTPEMIRDKLADIGLKGFSKRVDDMISSWERK